MQVSKWGNSLALRLPAVVVEVLDLKGGDAIEVEVEVAGVRRFAIERGAGAAQVLARLREFRGRLPADFRFDRLEANAR